MLTKNHAQMTVQVAALIGRAYWQPSDNAVGGKGCFIGCLSHSKDASKLGELYGLPLPLVRICEGIHEALMVIYRDEAVDFFSAIPAAVACDGKDLSRVHFAFLAAELRALPPVPDNIQAVIDSVIAGMDLMVAGKDWPKNAADAARAADAADAARDAAFAARDAADAARDAARAAAFAASSAAAFAADAARAADAASSAAAYAARAAAFAARAANAARAAAFAAAFAADAANAARAATFTARATAFAARPANRLRQRDTILRLIAEAPVMESTQ